MERPLSIQNAKQAYEAGHYEEAASLNAQILQQDPKDVEAKVLNGMIAFAQGRYSEAISILDAVLRASPESRDALLWLSNSFLKSGSLKAATGVAMRAAQLHPNDAQVLNQLGLCQMEMLILVEATSSFRKATQLHPESAEYATNLGTVLYMQGLHQESADSLRRATERDGSYAAAFAGLGRTLVALDQHGEAILCAERAIEIDPAFCLAQLLLAQMLIQGGRSTEAESHAEKAAQLEPDNALTHAVLAKALQSQGLVEKANERFLRSIELEPRQGNAYSGLIFGRKITEEDRKLEAPMLALVNDRALPHTEIEALQYALARLYEGLGEYEKAIQHYDEANRIARYVKFRGEPFDSSNHAAVRERVIAFFTKERFEELRGAGSECELPIFIVGMIRSGTTLMEQILASHPDVGAAGEQSFWTEAGPGAFDSQRGTLDRGKMGELAERYLAILEELAPEALRVTDKMPANTLALGFIHAALPNARIIHMTRNAADTCFSIYATPNEARIDFAHDKKNIAFAYSTQEKLIEHWRSVLPTDRFLDVSYEELIENRETVTRRVLKFCGLEWSELCMSPERSERSVATPSAWQVRQPVYNTSIQRWTHFEPWLPEFKELIEPN